MSLPNSSVAPIDTRLRLAISGLTISWLLAALFIVLAWRHESSARHEPPVKPAAVAHVLS